MTIYSYYEVGEKFNKILSVKNRVFKTIFGLNAYEKLYANPIGVKVIIKFDDFSSYMLNSHSLLGADFKESENDYIEIPFEII